VTTGSPVDAHPGALGQRSTAVLFGQDNLDFGMVSGVRAEAGIFLDSCHHYSIDVGGMVFFPDTIHQVFSSDAGGNPLIARPVFNTLVGEERSFVTSVPGTLAGSTAVDYHTELWGFEVNGRVNGSCTPHLNGELLAGFRFARLDEKLTISDELTPLVPGNITFLGPTNFVNPPSFLTDQDQFHTTNTFYGANLGARLSWDSEWFFVRAGAKLGLGITDQQVHIQGSTSVFSPTGVQTASGGILALPSNIGTYRRTVFGLLPEGSFTIGLNPCAHVRLLAGYSFLWWNNVVRPGNQIDHAVSPAQVPTDVNFGIANGGNRPVFFFHEQSFWVHTLNFGVVVYY
jgi:hypothetical protein